MSDEIKPALSAELWARLRQYNDHASFACIILEGGYDTELGIDHGSSDFAPDDARRATAAAAVLNDSLPDTDPRKITRARVNALREIVEHGIDHQNCGGPWPDAEFDPIAASARAAVDALAAILQPEAR